ncbi:MAG: 5-formyltetrahydrofolate cyclo-ligase [Chitinispirillales bacterium]|jgi:5-formyltetrahydrofolate cyclo-ligase|nr:5-formyltetrahydrofolate cyclo-ligase [Chitinispirillales bacterium]
MDSATELKQKLRDRYSAARASIKPSAAERKSLRVAANILSLLRRHGSELVLAYHKIGAEADASPLINLLLNFGLGVALPYCREDRSLGIGRILNPHSDLAEGAHGIMEPSDRFKDNIRPNQLSAIVCPGVAFDMARTRLGRGAGYYDRFLREVAGKALVIGCAFDCQISPEPLPRENHDIPMDAVVAETVAFPVGCCPTIKPPETED